MRRGAVKYKQSNMGHKLYQKLAFIASTRPEAQKALKAAIETYGNVDAADADAIVPLGGDGFMLQTLRRYLPLIQRGLPVYGMNQGTVGFLMNSYKLEDLPARLEQATRTKIHPLRMTAQAAGGEVTDMAFNEVSLFRQTQQAAHIKISVDGRERLGRLIADGVMLSTPVGSTAYNLSAHGPVIPLGADIMALTPISAFRPRRWRGALLSGHAKVRFDVLDPLKRPVSASADNSDVRHVTSIEIEEDRETTLTLLFDKDHGLDEKILQEQFAT